MSFGISRSHEHLGDEIHMIKAAVRVHSGF